MISTKRILTFIATLFIGLALVQPAFAERTTNLAYKNDTVFMYEASFSADNSASLPESIGPNGGVFTFNATAIDTEYHVMADSPAYPGGDCVWEFYVDSNGNISDTVKVTQGSGNLTKCGYTKVDEQNITLNITMQ